MGRYLPNVKQQFLDDNGAPLASGKVYTYIAGTTTPLVTYSDDEQTANANPVVLDSAGRADIWLDDAQSYKIRLTDSSDSIIWEVDNVPGSASALGVLNSWQSFAITDGQSATDLSGITVDSDDVNSRVFEYEIIRGTTVVSRGDLALLNENGTWAVYDGGWKGGLNHGVTWSVSQASTVGQLRAATSSGPGAGTIRLRQRFTEQNLDVSNLNGMVEAFAGYIETPSNNTIVIDESAAYAYSINSLIAKLSSGTIDASIQIDGTDVTGVDTVGLTSTQSSSLATGANYVAVGSKVTLVLENNSSAADLGYTIKKTRL